MADHLYCRVPRLVEQEQGHLADEAMEPSAADLTIVDAYYERLSRRWMAKPAESGAGSGSSDWTGTTTVEMSLLASGGTGVEVTAESWRLKRVDPLEMARGFYLDLWCYEPASVAAFTDPVTISWGGADSTKHGQWLVRLIPSEAGPGMAEVLEHDGADYVLVCTCVLLSGTFFNSLHRLWFQPLDEDEWLLSNRDVSDMGVLVRTKRPYVYDPDASSDTDDAEPEARVPWGPGALALSGTGRAWVVYRDLTYPHTWSVATKGQREFGYLCTQACTSTVSSWLPDGKRVYNAEEDTGSDYVVDLVVYEGEPVVGDDPAEWAADAGGKPAYGWRLTVTGPEDAGTGFSKLSVCVDRLLIHWPRTLASDGSTAVDLIGHATVRVDSLRESRSYRDDQADLVVTLRGPVADLDHYTAPGQRWQWVIDQAADGQPEDLLIRFDGIRDGAEPTRYTDVDDNWIGTAQVSIRTRWRQAEMVMYRGQLALDGALRSTAYASLFSLIPLDTTEVSIPTALPDDKVLPAGRRGDGPLWKPEIGMRLASLILSLQEMMGPKDRLMFRDVSGTPALVIDQPSAASLATFYRTQAEADAAGVPAQCIRGDKLRALVLTRDDSEFFNEITVQGEAPAPAIPDTASGATGELKRGAPIVRYYADPSSWKVAEIGGAPNLLYTGTKQTCTWVNLQLNTEAAVELNLRQMVDRFHRFANAGQFQGGFVPTLYPGDLVTIDAGTEPDATDKVLEIQGMSTEVVSLTLEASKRYKTIYEVGEVPG